MPQAIVPAIVGGVAQLGGALIGSGAQKNATKSQERSTTRAMQMQQAQEAEARRRYDQQWAEFQAQKAAYGQRRDAILAKYGISIPQAQAPAAAPGGPAPGVSAGGGAPMVPQRFSLADITQRTGGREQAAPMEPGPEMPSPVEASGAPPAAGPAMNLAALSDPTYSWRKYASA